MSRTDIRTHPAAPNSVNPQYFPIVFPQIFWQLKENSFPINETVTSIPLHLRLEPMSMTKFQIYATLDESFKGAATNPAMASSGSDLDEVKRVFLETNTVLLVTTIIITILHSVFEFLAFKNDVRLFLNTDLYVSAGHI